MKTKRVNKTKDQIASEIKHFEKVNREKALVKLMFPIIANQSTIYNAQTVLSALSGFIKNEMDKRSSEFLVRDLKIDLSKEKDGEIKTAINTMIGLLEIEKAKESALLLERFANILAQHSASEFMKKPMSDISIDKIIAQ